MTINALNEDAINDESSPGATSPNDIEETAAYDIQAEEVADEVGFDGVPSVVAEMEHMEVDSATELTSETLRAEAPGTAET